MANFFLRSVQKDLYVCHGDRRLYSLHRCVGQLGIQSLRLAVLRLRGRISGSGRGVVVILDGCRAAAAAASAASAAADKLIDDWHRL